MNQAQKKKTLFVIGLIAVVNALGYGIIIPILYSYSLKFGLSDFQNGLLLAVFSICQFVATPFIGRLSDKYGRRPLLLISILGSAASFFLMAVAQSPALLFLARALDGITAGNLPVAFAAISDTTDEKERAKGFGIVGAAFGFGFILGPAISAFTTKTSLAMPFWIAGIVALIGALVTAFLLPETNKHKGEVKKGKILDLKQMVGALADKNVGPALIIILLYSLAFSAFIYAFNPVAVKIHQLNPDHISILFTIMGVIGLIVQGGLLGPITQKLGFAKTFLSSIVGLAGIFLALYFFRSTFVFAALVTLVAIPNGFIQPLTNTLLSKETDAKSQGSVLGLGSSYMSVGQILGPLVGGALASFSVESPFLAASACIAVCFVLAQRALSADHRKESAF